MKTNAERQQARRLREKQWLKDHGFTSWEQLHTKLMSNIIFLDIPRIPEETVKQIEATKKGKQS
jgi:hypothetical protein